MRKLADHQSMVGTTAQIGTRLWTLVRLMSPTWHLPGLAALSPDFAATHGIDGIIWDVDGTLTSHHGSVVLPGTADAFAALLAMPGLRHVIVSNASEQRFYQLGNLFPAIPVIRAYRLDERVEFQLLVHRRESWSSATAAGRITGAQVIRKPSAELVHRAVRELGCPPERAVMVGDQYLTDVAGAALAGVRSIKLPTLARPSFPLGVRAAQRLEQFAYWIFHQRSNDDAGHSPGRREAVR